MYDYIVIGAGVAGLYFAYKNLFDKNYLILDKRDYIGGRLKTVNFHGKNIELGGAVIEDSNPHVLNLVKELGLKLNEGRTTYYHEYKELNNQEIEQILKNIKDTFIKNKNEIKEKKLTFKQFLHIYFDDKFVQLIDNVSDYTDFYNDDVESVIFDYPLDDLIVKNTHTYRIDGGYSVLVNKLLEKINKNNIILNKKIISVIKNNNIIITCEDHTIYETKKLILCGDISINQIKYEGFGRKINNILDYIGSNPFMRVYSYHDKINFDKIIRVSNPIHKIIPMSENILMSVYADNYDADFFYDIVKKSGKKGLTDVIEKLLKKTNNNFTEIKDFIMRYWKIGTHYFKPYSDKNVFNQEELIKDGVLICGEMISNRQGWVEGAIGSVNENHHLFLKLDKL